MPTCTEAGVTLVFLEKDRILFQVQKGDQDLVRITEIMFNDNVVDFDLYAGTYFGYFIAFLEDFAVTIKKRLPQGKISFKPEDTRTLLSEELTVVYSWIKRILKESKK